MGESPREQEGLLSDPMTVGSRVHLRKGSPVCVESRKGGRCAKGGGGSVEEAPQSLITICILTATEAS